MLFVNNFYIFFSNLIQTNLDQGKIPQAMNVMLMICDNSIIYI